VAHGRAALGELVACSRGHRFGAFGCVGDDSSSAAFLFEVLAYAWFSNGFRSFSVLNSHFHKLNITVSFNIFFLSYVISKLPHFPARLFRD